jgi:hypothetical protein
MLSRSGRGSARDVAVTASTCTRAQPHQDDGVNRARTCTNSAVYSDATVYPWLGEAPRDVNAGLRTARVAVRRTCATTRRQRRPLTNRRRPVNAGRRPRRPGLGLRGLRSTTRHGPRFGSCVARHRPACAWRSSSRPTCGVQWRRRRCLTRWLRSRRSETRPLRWKRSFATQGAMARARDPRRRSRRAAATYPLDMQKLDPAVPSVPVRSGLVSARGIKIPHGPPVAQRAADLPVL